MRTFHILTTLSLLVLLLQAGCASPPPGEARLRAPAVAAVSPDMPPRPAVINHFVEFKLHDPADADELIADCDRYLARIPGVVSYFAGRHHDIGRGDRVYSDYHVGFFVGFNSDEDYRVYVDHPDHVMIVQKWLPRLARLRVYDVWDDGQRE
jgi:hypothetical protein